MKTEIHLKKVSLLSRQLGSLYGSKFTIAQSPLFSHLSISFLVSVVILGWNTTIVSSLFNDDNVEVFEGIFNIHKWFLRVFIIQLVCSSFLVGITLLVYNYLTSFPAQLLTIGFAIIFNCITLGLVPITFLNKIENISIDFPKIFLLSFSMAKSWVLPCLLQMAILGTVISTYDFSEYKVSIFWIGSFLKVSNWYEVFVTNSQITTNLEKFIICFLFSSVTNMLVQLKVTSLLNLNKNRL